MKKQIPLGFRVRMGLAAAAGLALATGAVAEQGSAGSPPVAASTNSLSLDEAVRQAVRNNPLLRAARSKVAAAEGRAAQSGLWSNPELEFIVDDWPLSDGGFPDSKRTVGVSQVLPFPGKKSLERQIGRSGVVLSESELSLRHTELVRDVKATFYRVLATEGLVELAGELVRMVGESVEAARKRVEAGAIGYQEQLRVEIQFEQARGGRSDLERELVTARQALASLLGSQDLGSVRLAGRLSETPEAGAVFAGAGEWMTRHPSLTVAQVNLRRAQLEQRRARLEPYPDVKAALAGGTLGDTDQGILQAGIAVPLPVFDTFRGRKREAEANLVEAEAQVSLVRNELHRQWSEAMNRRRMALDEVARYRERIVPKAAEALRLVTRGFEEGKLGLIDLLDTQRISADTRIVYQQKLLELNLAEAELEALLRPQVYRSAANKQDYEK